MSEPYSPLEEGQYLKFVVTGEKRHGGFVSRGEPYFKYGNIEIWTDKNNYGRCWIVAKDVDEYYAELFLAREKALAQERERVAGLQEEIRALRDALEKAKREASDAENLYSEAIAEAHKHAWDEGYDASSYEIENGVHQPKNPYAGARPSPFEDAARRKEAVIQAAEALREVNIKGTDSATAHLRFNAEERLFAALASFREAHEGKS